MDNRTLVDTLFNHGGRSPPFVFAKSNTLRFRLHHNARRGDSPAAIEHWPKRPHNHHSFSSPTVLENHRELTHSGTFIKQELGMGFRLAPGHRSRSVATVLAVCAAVRMLSAGLSQDAGIAAHAAEGEAAPAESTNLMKFRERYPSPRGLRTESRDVFFLELHDRPYTRRSVLPGSLLRELCRQAVLIAARDELGLATRDRALREEFPHSDTPTLWPLSVLAAVSPEFVATVTLIQDRPEGPRVVWEQSMPLDASARYESLAAAVEHFSREEFPKVLQAEGYLLRQAPQMAAPGKVDAKVEARLQRLNDLSQYAALRAVHGAIAKEGESAERLGALVRGYANLSVLTDSYVSPMSKVFAARSLLYAERLKAKFPDSPQGAWTSAYALCLIGLPEGALRQLELARPQQGEANPPEWLPVIEASCKGDLATLRQLDAKRRKDPLAACLLWQNSQQVFNEQSRFRALAQMLKREPDCLAAMFDAAANPSLGAKAGSQVTLERLPDYVARQLPEVGNLPESVTELLEGGNLTTGAEFAKLTAALKVAGAAGNDPHEPSLDLAGQMLRESAFIAAGQVLDYERNWIGIDVTQRLGELSAWVAGHPQEGALAAQAQWGDAWMQAGGAIIQACRPEEQEAGILAARSLFSAAGPYLAMELEAAADGHLDATVSEQFIRIRGTHSERDQLRLTEELIAIAGRTPIAVEAQLRWGRPLVLDRAPEIEERYADDPSIQQLLANMYLEATGDDEGAERCARRWIAKEPSFQAWHKLAEIMRLRGDTSGWLKAADESLKHPVMGLEHAEVQATIAEHYLHLDLPNKALPYAQAAAGTGAQWAMLSAAKVHERLGQMEEAERYHSYISQRYQYQEFNWLFWCLRTGSGDFGQALQFAEQSIGNWRSDLEDENQTRCAIVEMLGEDYGAALKRMLPVARRTRTPFYVWFTAALTDHEAAAPERSELLQRIIQLEYAGEVDNSSGTGEIAAELDRQLKASATQPLDVERFDRMIARQHPVSKVNLWYFLGQFLMSRGQEDAALTYLRRSAESPEPDLWTQSLAAHLLRNRGAKLELRKTNDIPDIVENTKGGQILRRSTPIDAVRMPVDGQAVFVDSLGSVFDWDLSGADAKEWPHARGQLVDVSHAGQRVLLATNGLKSWEVWRRDSETADMVLTVDAASGRTARFLRGGTPRIVRADLRRISEKFPGTVLSVWNWSTSKEEWRVELHNIMPVGMVSASEKVLVAGRKNSHTGWIGVYNDADGTLVTEWDVPHHAIERVAASSDGKRGATLSIYGEVCVWNLSEETIELRFWTAAAAAATAPQEKDRARGYGEGSPATYLTMSGDGRRLATVGGTQVCLYDLTSGRLVTVINDHAQVVKQAAFSPDGEKLATASSDMTVRVFDVAQLSAGTASSMPATVLTNTLGMPFVPIGAGGFMMGERDGFTPNPENQKVNVAAERPRHWVELTRPYYLCEHETTVGEFRQFVEATGYVTDAERLAGGRHMLQPIWKHVRLKDLTWRHPGFEQDDSHPVVQVSWNDAQKFCAWLSEKEDRTYRLPTEAEWEYACRAGSSLSWPAGNKPANAADGVANGPDQRLAEMYDFSGPSNSVDDGHAFTAPAYQFQPNSWGLYDMHGNAFEWCADFWDPGYYAQSPTVNPTGPEDGKNRALRGGSFLHSFDDTRSAHRASGEPGDTDSTFGFRVLLEVAEQ